MVWYVKALACQVSLTRVTLLHACVAMVTEAKTSNRDSVLLCIYAVRRKVQPVGPAVYCCFVVSNC